MTDLITEARELCEKATPGPWWYQDKEKWLGHGDRENYRGGVLANAEYDWEDQEAVLEIKPSDAAFIARSRTLIPELCNALEKPNTELDRLTEAQRWVPMSERFPTEKDADRLGFIIAHSDSMGQSTVCVWHHVLDDGVTSHWMPLPAAPEEGAEK